MPLNRDEETYLGGLIEDNITSRPDMTTEEELMRQDLNPHAQSMTPRERDIMHLRYGLEDGRQRTLEEVGRLFNITRERVRQIEHKAFRKLRQPATGLLSWPDILKIDKQILREIKAAKAAFCAKFE